MALWIKLSKLRMHATFNNSFEIIVLAFSVHKSILHQKSCHSVCLTIIQKKSASSIRTLPLVLFNKNFPFFQNQCYFTVFPGKTKPKVPFFLKILDAALKFQITLLFDFVFVFLAWKQLSLISYILVALLDISPF